MKPLLSIPLPPSARVARVLLTMIAVLAILSFMGQFSRFVLGHARLLGFVEEFNLDVEGNIPTYFSGLLLLCGAFLAAAVARLAGSAATGYSSHWVGLALILAYISLDEVATLHERLIYPLQQLLEADGIFYFAWVIPGILLVCLFVGAYAQFFWALPVRWKMLFGAAGALYVAGGLGMELVGGWYASQYGVKSLVYSSMTTVEEVLEMTGIAVLIYALLEYLRAHIAGVFVPFDQEKESSKIASSNFVHAEPIREQERRLLQLEVKPGGDGMPPV